MSLLDPSFLKTPDFIIEDQNGIIYEIDEVSTHLKELVFILKPNKNLAKFYYIKKHSFGLHAIQEASDTPRNLDGITPTDDTINTINKWFEGLNLRDI